MQVIADFAFAATVTLWLRLPAVRAVVHWRHAIRTRRKTMLPLTHVILVDVIADLVN